MYAVLIVLGFAMGIASTLTISGVVHIAPAEAYGTALTLRMTGNRIGQVMFPALSGLLAAATGVAGHFRDHRARARGLGRGGADQPARARGGGDT